MSKGAREFGERVAGAEYVDRPGGYAVVRASSGEIAVVAAPGGLYLPGGGQEAGESPADAAVREMHEECGLRIRVTGEIGTADQFVTSSGEGVRYRKRCAFFTAELIAEEIDESEEDHLLRWMPLTEAEALLTDGSQRWAVSTLIRSDSHQIGRDLT